MNHQAKRLSKESLFWLGMVLLLFNLVVPATFAMTNQVPIHGTFSGAGETFAGNATHLGYFNGVIDNTTVPPNAVWTAANGDTLTNITTSFVIDFSVPAAPNVYPYTQTIEFTGGSGRFQNVTGSAERGVAQRRNDGQDGRQKRWTHARRDCNDACLRR